MTTEADVLARLRVVQGRSASDVREFIRSRGQALLTVGADPQCDWCIQEAGVAPVHFSLHWDGATLRIADTHGAGRVRVDGTLLGPEFRRLGGRARIDFGRAAIVVEAFAGDDYGSAPIHRGTLPEIQTGLPSSGGSSSVRPTEPTYRAPAYTGAGTTLAHVDQRTVHGYVPPGTAVQVSGSVRIAGAELGAGAATARGRQTVLEDRPSIQPEIQLVSEPSPHSIVLHRDEPGRHVRVDEPGRQVRLDGSVSGSPATFADQAARIPKAVLVLSPADGPVPSAEPEPYKPVSVRPPRPLAPWTTVALGVSAVVGGYAAWVYLLYHL